MKSIWKTSYFRGNYMFHSSALEDFEQKKNTILDEIICINNDSTSEYSFNFLIYFLIFFSFQTPVAFLFLGKT